MLLQRCCQVAAVVGLVLISNKPYAVASQKPVSSNWSQKKQIHIANDSYIVGPGDGLIIELLDLPELSGQFTIGPDGTLYLPRLRSLYVEGLTIEELRTVLTREFRKYVREPQIYVRPVSFRPVRIYVGGEVKRPGFYTLSSSQGLPQFTRSQKNVRLQPINGNSNIARMSELGQIANFSRENLEKTTYYKPGSITLRIHQQ